ncbi:hypothetical protein ACET3Z_012807 [Daucus carota]
MMTNGYKSTSRNTPSFMRLPLELQYSEIFLRLPLTSLWTCKRVCKAFRTLIENPSFEHIHVTTSHSLLLQFKHEHWGLVSIDCTTKDVISYVSLIPKIPYVGKLSLVGSCNGLVCFVVRIENQHEDDVLLLWNPFTEQSRFIPMPDFDEYWHEQTLEFYFVPETNDYVVLSIGFFKYYKPDQINVAVYRMRRKAWEIADQIQLGHRFNCYEVLNDYRDRERGTSVFLNGCFHWMFSSIAESSEIVSFNVRDGVLRRIWCIDIDNDWIDPCTIGIIDESLALLCRNCYNDDLEIYVMSDYEVNDSWVLKYKRGPDDVLLNSFGENSGMTYDSRHSMYFCNMKDLKKKIMKVISPEGSCLSGFSSFSLPRVLQLAR